MWDSWERRRCDAVASVQRLARATTDPERSTLDDAWSDCHHDMTATLERGQLRDRAAWRVRRGTSGCGCVSRHACVTEGLYNTAAEGGGPETSTSLPSHLGRPFFLQCIRGTFIGHHRFIVRNLGLADALMPVPFRVLSGSRPGLRSPVSHVPSIAVETRSQLQRDKVAHGPPSSSLLGKTLPASRGPGTHSGSDAQAACRGRSRGLNDTQSMTDAPKNSTMPRISHPPPPRRHLHAEPSVTRL